MSHASTSTSEHVQFQRALGGILSKEASNHTSGDSKQSSAYPSLREIFTQNDLDELVGITDSLNKNSNRDHSESNSGIESFEEAVIENTAQQIDRIGTESESDDDSEVETSYINPFVVGYEAEGVQKISSLYDDLEDDDGVGEKERSLGLEVEDDSGDDSDTIYEEGGFSAMKFGNRKLRQPTSSKRDHEPKDEIPRISDFSLVIALYTPSSGMYHIGSSPVSRPPLAPLSTDGGFMPSLSSWSQSLFKPFSIESLNMFHVPSYTNKEYVIKCLTLLCRVLEHEEVRLNFVSTQSKLCLSIQEDFDLNKKHQEQFLTKNSSTSNSVLKESTSVLTTTAETTAETTTETTATETTANSEVNDGELDIVNSSSLAFSTNTIHSQSNKDSQLHQDSISSKDEKIRQESDIAYDHASFDEKLSHLEQWKRSALMRDLVEVYRSLFEGTPLQLQINGFISLSLLHPTTSLSLQKPLASSFQYSNLHYLVSNVSHLFSHPKPFQSLLLSAPSSSLLSLLPPTSHPIMQHIIVHNNPLRSLEEQAPKLGISLNVMLKLASHLQRWGFATLISTPVWEAVYVPLVSETMSLPRSILTRFVQEFGFLVDLVYSQERRPSYYNELNLANTALMAILKLFMLPQALSLHQILSFLNEISLENSPKNITVSSSSSSFQFSSLRPNLAKSDLPIESQVISLFFSTHMELTARLSEYLIDIVLFLLKEKLLGELTLFPQLILPPELILSTLPTIDDCHESMMYDISSSTLTALSASHFHDDPEVKFQVQSKALNELREKIIPRLRQAIQDTLNPYHHYYQDQISLLEQLSPYLFLGSFSLPDILWREEGQIGSNVSYQEGAIESSVIFDLVHLFPSLLHLSYQPVL